MLIQTGCSFTASVSDVTFRGEINGSRVDLRVRDSGCSGESRGNVTLTQNATTTEISGVTEGGLDGLRCCSDPNGRGLTRIAFVTLTRRGS